MQSPTIPRITRRTLAGPGSPRMTPPLQELIRASASHQPIAQTIAASSYHRLLGDPSGKIPHVGRPLVAYARRARPRDVCRRQRRSVVEGASSAGCGVRAVGSACTEAPGARGAASPCSNCRTEGSRRAARLVESSRDKRRAPREREIGLPTRLPLGVATRHWLGRPCRRAGQGRPWALTASRWTTRTRPRGATEAAGSAMADGD